MNGTPRLRSAYPATPPYARNTPRSNTGTPRSPNTPTSPKLPDISSLTRPKPEPGAPLISFDVIDAPSQRLYAFGVFVLLWIWRLYDWSNLMADETESLWLFMKWLVLDLTYLYFLESAHIPWLEFGPGTQMFFFSVHAILNGLLMFRIPIRFLTWLGALTNYLWDSELAISGASVKYSNVVNNPSLILGKQIIHVLPEGSAILNPDHIPICLDSTKFAPVTLPLRINQTIPISIELIRFDLDSESNETLTITAKEAKKLRKDAMKGNHIKPSDPLTLQVQIKKPGLYRLHRIIDETRMDVQQKASSEALVVSCPSASISSHGRDRCRSELSNIAIEVSGTPPLRVKYRRSVNGKESEMSYQSIQPEDFVSPLSRKQGGGHLITTTGKQDLSWARSQHVTVPLNESLDHGGLWSYSIEQVTDALQNSVSYAQEEDADHPKSRAPHSEQGLMVHERPKVSFKGQDLQRPLRIATGQSAQLPLHFSSTARIPIGEAHTLTYRFTPFEKKQDEEESQDREVTVLADKQAPHVNEEGLYRLLSVKTSFCDGEVLEPSSFMLVNPPAPDLTIASEGIIDKCVNRDIGFRVELNLVGTPPFRVHYTVQQQGRKQIQTVTREVTGLRDQIELKPHQAGHYTYTFTEVDDAVYKGVSMKMKQNQLTLAHDVRPAAYASFIDPSPRKRACIEQSAKFDVRLEGEGPWKLHYEIAHNSRKTKVDVPDIESDRHTIVTPPLMDGGDYSIILTGVTDGNNCKETLQEDAKVQVRHQRPKGAFGFVEGKRSLRTLEAKSIDIPLRLSGEGPWTVDYQFVDSFNTTNTHSKQVRNPNDIITTKEPGTYTLLNVRDSFCPGTVELGADVFDIAWIGRPVATVNPTTVLEKVGDHFERKAICEGEEDAFEVFLYGRPPYDLSYVESVAYTSGHKAVQKEKEMHVPLNSAQIKMDSSQAGTYTYSISKLGDSNYDHSSKKHTPLKVQQRVLERPTIAFKEPGKVYAVCQSQDREATSTDEQSIPVKLLTGEPPFSFELEITRPGRGGRSEILTFSNAEDRDFAALLPSSRLPPGNSIVNLRKVRDRRGCERNIQPGSAEAQRVQISVHDVPTISPLESKQNYCVGDRIGFSLTGMAPYTIFYNFEGKTRKATETSSSFRRLAEQPGTFVITSVQDSNSACKRNTKLIKTIHPYPNVKVSKGRETRVDIHAGGQAEITFDFGGTPPFTFTYTRSENVAKGDKKRPGQVLETKTLVTSDMSHKIMASDEGTYEVIAIKDAHCSYAKPGNEGALGESRLIKNE